MLLKIMGADPVHDGDARKTYRVLANIAAVDFDRDASSAHARVTFLDSDAPETFDVPGNAYLMADDGKTISAFSGSPLPMGLSSSFGQNPLVGPSEDNPGREHAVRRAKREGAEHMSRP